VRNPNQKAQVDTQKPSKTDSKSVNPNNGSLVQNPDPPLKAAPMKPDGKGFVNSSQLPPNKKTCAVCKSGVPCEYPTEVDLRIIVLGFNREDSISKCLGRIPKLELDGARVAVDIWLDVTPEHMVHYPTYLASQNFSSTWQQGEACVHVQTEHSHADHQWLLSWRPKHNSKEMVLIIEDDIDISPYAVRWLLAANRTFHEDRSIYAYSIKSEFVCSQVNSGCTPIPTPGDAVAFKMPLFGNWGWSPKGSFWRRFQDWYLETRSKHKNYKPYVEGLQRYNSWYKSFEKKGTERTMSHEMYIIHYVAGHKEKIYCLYHNLLKFTGLPNAKLSTHRQENGMHFHGQTKKGKELELLTEWKPSYINFTLRLPFYDNYGNFVPNFEQSNL
jgi:hypothetical protein